MGIETISFGQFVLSCINLELDLLGSPHFTLHESLRFAEAVLAEEVVFDQVATIFKLGPVVDRVFQAYPGLHRLWLSELLHVHL